MPIASEVDVDNGGRPVRCVAGTLGHAFYAGENLGSASRGEQRGGTHSSVCNLMKNSTK